jgi:hypothetical protein
MNASARIPINLTTSLAVRKPKAEPEFMSVAERAPETIMKRLDAMLSEAGSQERGMQIGFMAKRGDLGKSPHSEVLFRTCMWFFERHVKYLEAVGAKTIKSPSFELTSKSEPPDPFSEVGLRKAKAEQKVIAEFESAELAALACGRDRYKQFCAVVLDDAAPLGSTKTEIREVAEAIWKHRGLSSRHRRGRR